MTNRPPNLKLIASDPTHNLPYVVNTSSQGSLVDYLQSDGRFTILLKLMQTSCLEHRLVAPKEHTVFALQDVAFEPFEPTSVRSLCSEFSRTEAFLFVSQFLIPSRSDSKNFLGKRIWASNIVGDRMLIDGRGGVFEGARLQTMDVQVGNGTVQHLKTMISSPRVFCPLARKENTKNALRTDLEQKTGSRARPTQLLAA